MHMLPWGRTLKIIACTFHGVAIASTVFRLIHRWYTAYFWWEDAWAVIALVADVTCVVSAALEVPVTVQGTPPIDKTAIWIASIGFPCVLWACRMSILLSVVRVANHSQGFRRAACFVGCSFLVTWTAMIAQRIQICLTKGCIIAGSVGISQLITDVIADVLLVVLPVYFLRTTKINHKQRIMIFSAFSASLLITVVTIVHSTALITVQSNRDGIIVIGHVKSALSLIVCNLLVIVAFVYRMCRRGSDLGAAEEGIAFTTVDLNVYPTTVGTVDKHTTTVGPCSMASETSRSTTPEATEVERAEGVVGSRLS